MNVAEAHSSCMQEALSLRAEGPLTMKVRPIFFYFVIAPLKNME